MKNISVGKKMLLGFGAVILMICLILGLTTITSIQRNQDLTQVALMSALQRESNLMLDNFNLARVEIRSLFTSIDAEEEFYAAIDYLAISDEHILKMEELSTQLDNYKLDEIETLRKMFESVNAAITAVANNDGAVNEGIAEMVRNGTVMTESTTEMSNLVIQVILGLGDDDPDRALERVENVVLPVTALNSHVDAIRIDSRGLMLAQDASVIPGLYTGLDELLAEATAIRATLSTDEARAAADAMMSAVVGFRDSVSVVEGLLKSSDAEIAAARTVFGELNVLVDNLVMTISDGVDQLSSDVVSTSQSTMVIIISVGIFAAVFSVVVALYLSRSITRPLVKMKNVMAQAGSTGNLSFSDEVREDIRKEGLARDELGQSLKAFSQFVQQITYTADCLKKIADRDLSIDVRILSEEDTMGNALANMLENLNDVFSEINKISKQVAAASHEVAVGAQSLAQGSTEQAATVQEISASITEINDQMSQSNETARSAAVQGNEIGQIANEGNEKMNHLIGSMAEIGDASQAIGRVIKVIDDIASQTNILSLNAAVEAARAGQHGKGFAVVAEEVRSLAAKSAEAAKETAELISRNLVKTEQGLSYTHDTAASLAKIIEGIGETNQSLQRIAEQSQNTRVATSEVTSAVDQVSMVIQQNSATSEESAAASQQMSSQAQTLQEYISRFKLRGQSHSDFAPGLPSPAPARREEAPIVEDDGGYHTLGKY